MRQAALELALEEPDLRAGKLVERFQVLVRGDPRVGDDQDPVLDVIERQDGIEQHEPGGVGAVARRAQIAEHRLEPGCRAVAEIPDRAAGESRQIGHERRPEVGHQTAQRLDEGPIAGGQLPRPLDRLLAVARPQDQERILAEKRIPADVLAAFDAFQEKRVVRVFGDLQERRDRREEVGDDLLAHRHERAAPGQLLELVE